ncbi:MAG: hypothetical protein WCL32_04860 [Planctomycetota bacterium]|jgi:hypothetical protein
MFCFKKLLCRVVLVRHFVIELLVAWCLAFIVWMYMHSRSHQAIEHVQVPLAIQLLPSQRDHFMLELPNVPKATVTLSGPSSRMRELKKKLYNGQIQAVVQYTVPEDKQKESAFCDMANFEAAKLNVPPGIMVEWNDANLSIPVTVHRLVERTLPVKLDFTGDVRISNVKIEPATVTVRGPKVVLDRAQALNTLPFELSVPAEEDPKETQAREGVDLATELDGRAVQVTPSQVHLKCKVMPRKKIYEVTDLPIRFAIPDRFPWHARFAETGGKLSLRIVGPAGEEVPRVRAYVDLAQEVFGRGRNVSPVRLELPKDFELVERRTPMAAFYLDDLDLVEHNAARPTPGFEIRPVSQPKSKD